MNRRWLLATTALAIPIAGCAAIEKITGTSTPTAAGEAIVLDCQYLLPLLDAMALGISIAVPASAPAMALVMTGITNAGPIFQQLSSTMAVAQAQPLVQQIETYASGALTSIASVVNAAPALSAYATRVAQAEAVLGLLTTFVNGAATLPTAARAPTVLPSLLHR